MKGVTVLDAQSFLDLLNALGEDALTSEWSLDGIDCLGDRADDLHQVSDAEIRISGQELIEIVSGVTQTLEGYFRAFRQEDDIAWMIIRAVEDDYDVQTDDRTIFLRLQERFSRVVPFPNNEKPNQSGEGTA